MKYILILSVVAVFLGGCAGAPAGYDDNRDGYYRERGYNRDDGNYRDRDYSYRVDRGNQGYAYQDHGS